MNSTVQVLNKRGRDTRIQTVLEVNLPRKREPSPSLATCRYGVLPLQANKKIGKTGYVSTTGSSRALSMASTTTATPRLMSRSSTTNTPNLMAHATQPVQEIALPTNIALGLGLIYPEPPIHE